MALSMSLAGTSEDIDSNEQYFLVMAAAKPRLYPALAAVWNQFYDSRVIDADRPAASIGPDDANAIVHELIMLLAANHADRALTQLVVRLLPFFSQAYRTQESILCRSS
jgi:hypothetical protein